MQYLPLLLLGAVLALPVFRILAQPFRLAGKVRGISLTGIVVLALAGGLIWLGGATRQPPPDPAAAYAAGDSELRALLQ